MNKFLTVIAASMMLCLALAVCVSAVYDGGASGDDDAFADDAPIGAYTGPGIAISAPLDIWRIGTNAEYPVGSGQMWTMTDTYYQTNDIDMTGTTYGGLGTSTYQFGGTYYGNGFKISNLRTPTIGVMSYGLFNYATNASFYDMVMESPTVALASGQFSGSIVARAVGCEFINCKLIGTVTGTVTGTATTNVLFGGLVGDAYLCQLIGCANEATISITGPYVQIGGLASQTNFSIFNRCYNSGNVTATATAGSGTCVVSGLIGYITTGGTMSHITNCYNTGDVRGVRTMSGNQAYVSGIIRGSNLVMITNCYNTGNITWSLLAGAMPVQYGGISACGTAASAQPHSMFHCVVLDGSVQNNVIGGGGSFDFNNVIGTSAEMRPTIADARAGNSIYYTLSSSVFVGWDFFNIWNIDPAVNNGYPTLRAIDDPFTDNRYMVAFDTNGGSFVTPQIIPEGDTVTAPADPTRDGYTFTGWFVDYLLTAEYDFATPVYYDMILFAGWEPTGSGVSYLVAFDTNGGSFVAPQIIPDGSTASAPADPTRDGYTFKGWFADGQLTAAFDFATPITGDTVLFAGWEASGGGGGKTIALNITLDILLLIVAITALLILCAILVKHGKG